MISFDRHGDEVQHVCFLTTEQNPIEADPAGGVEVVLPILA